MPSMPRPSASSARWQESGFLGTPSNGTNSAEGAVPGTRTPSTTNAEAIELIKGACGSVVHLPPSGKYFNPVELLLNDLKQYHLRRKPLHKHVTQSKP